MKRYGLGILLAVCGAGLAAQQRASDPAAPPGLIRFTGTCDGSAAAWIDDSHFVDASDEDGILRLYAAQGGEPLQALNVNAHLGLSPKDEPDIEGAAKVGNRIYWITSHGLNSDGVIRPERYRLFATDLAAGAGPFLVPTGRAFAGLLKGLYDAGNDKKAPVAGFRDLDLPSAAKRPPEGPGGLNIEGLAAGRDGSLLIGLRNPVAGGGRALVVPLLNPAEVVDTARAAAPKFAPPIALDLGGQGIRDIAWTGRDYLILAGPSDDPRPAAFALFRWNGPGTTDVQRLQHSLAGMRPEAIAANAQAVLILSDDGDEKPTGADKCKNLKPPATQTFVGRLVPPGELR